MKFKATNVQLSSSGGEGFQVILSESKIGQGAYVLLQNYFEFEHGPAYFECSNLDLAGHGRVKHCEVRRDSLEIDLKDSAEHVTITFDTSEENVGQLVWLLDIIFAGCVRCVNSSGLPEIPMKEPDEDVMF